jgi:hypothetical protein
LETLDFVESSEVKVLEAFAGDGVIDEEESIKFIALFSNPKSKESLTFEAGKV